MPRASRPRSARRPQRRPAEFEAERARARTLDDPQIAAALDGIGDRHGIAEWLAAGPQLLRELERARSSDDPVLRVGVAIVDAARDCHRVGFTGPLPTDLLRVAHRL